MPNHSYSILKFHYHDDKGEKIRAIESLLKGEDSPLDFNKIIPMPKEQEDNWYNWSIANWGTKWNAYDVTLATKGDWKLVYRFSTAWSIPEPVIKKLAEMFPDVAIEFIAADDGGWFAYNYYKAENEDFKILRWTTDDGNDPDHSIRSTIYESLNISY